MNYLQSLDKTSTVAAAASLTAAALAVSMGLFGKNHMPVEGRTVLLTGATEGLGRSAACQLSAQGANIIIVSRNAGRLAEAIAEIKAAARSPQSQRFHHISADVSEPNYAEGVLAEVIRWNGGAAPDIVWCVAGVATPMLWADDGAMDATRRNMDVNFFGSADMAHAILREWLAPDKAVAPGQPRPEPKHLILTASVAALFTVAGYAPYAPSKWALRGLADTLAMELRMYPDNPVEVHLVLPGTITSPGLERENQTKPGITFELEKDDPAQTPEVVARKSIQGLQAGHYLVTVSYLGELMRCGIMGGSPRNNWLIDTLIGWLVPIIYFFVTSDLNSKVVGWAKKHGHPGSHLKR